MMGGVGRGMDAVLKEQIGRNLANPQVPNATRDRLSKELDRILTAMKEKAELPADVPPELGTLFNETTVDIIHGYLTYDVGKQVAAYRGPVLVMNGALDIQVSAERDAKPLYEMLKSRGAAQLVIVPNASHNFKHVENETEPGITGPVEPAALKAVTEFLTATLIR
jgi:fermentation-respiration switch protein FrsA (DUF1100 family)